MLTGFAESDDNTVLKFNRKFDTCDPQDKKIEVRQVFIEKNPINGNHYLSITVRLPDKVLRQLKSVALKNILLLNRRLFSFSARYHKGSLRLSHGGPDFG